MINSMRAKTVFRKAYVFDFDETIAITKAKIHVYVNGAYIRSLTPKEYNLYKPGPNDKLDFSEFNDGELILDAKKYKMWPVLQNVSDAIKEDRSTSEIYILTARTPDVKSYIYEFLKNNGIEINIKNIITLSDENNTQDIPEEKLKYLHTLSKNFDEVLFFDDDPKNIAMANTIKGIKTRLVENKNKK